jgi:hypothetical protein
MAIKDDVSTAIISTKLACVVLKLTQPRLAQLEQQGFIARTSPGRWRLVDLVQGYVKFLKEETKRRTGTASLSRVQEARALEIEQRTARNSARTIELEDAVGLVDSVIGGIRADLNGLPARCTRDLDERVKLEVEINDVLTRAADRLDQESAAAAAGGVTVAATSAASA